MMIFYTFIDPNFDFLSHDEKNTVLWAVIFHDIIKRGFIF